MMTMENSDRQDCDQLDVLNASIAGVLSHPWFPTTWGRRALMAAIFLVGLEQAVVAGNQYALLLWLLLPLFSPRVMGNAAFLLGRFMAGLHGR